MARFGIPLERALGVRVVDLRRLKRKIACDTTLARTLFATGIHEAQILASMVARIDEFTREDMDLWVSDFDSWDVCDQCCINLFRYTPFAYDKCREYIASEREFTRRAGFALVATLAVGDKGAVDAQFLPLLALVSEYSTDPRDSVKKAINWALRQIGKRSRTLYPVALSLSRELAASENRQARWIGRDALRELTTEKIIARIK